MTVESKEAWSAGDRYEPYVGRWSRLVAKDFLAWLAVPADRDWLDVGCGTGALTRTILETCAPHVVEGVEPSAEFIDYARTRVADPRVTFAVGDAQNLPVDAASFDAVVAGLVVNFVPQPPRAIAEMTRATRAGGVVAAYVWDYAGKMELMRHFWDAAVDLDPSVRELDEGIRFPLCQPDALEAAFQNAGLTAIQVVPIEVPTRFRDFDDYWTPFLGGQGPAPFYAMSIDEASRNRLRDRIRERLPIQPDGSIPLIARAWAIRSRVPG